MQTLQPEVVASPARKLTLSGLLGASVLGACWLMWVAPDPGFDRYHLPKELWLACTTLAVVVFALCARARWRFDRVSALTLASLGFAALSSAFATSPALSVRALSLQLAAVVLFLAARSAPRAELLPRYVVVAGMGVALVALAEGTGLLTGLSRAGRTPGATLGQRNTVAHLLVLASPCAWYIAASAQGRLLRSFGCAASALFGATLLLTRSRAGWLGLAAALSVFVASWCLKARTYKPDREPATSRAGVFAPVAFTVLGAGLMASSPSRLAWSSATPYADTLTRLLDAQHGSGAGRLAQYRASLALVREHPCLGTGPGNWLVEYPRVASSADALTRHTWLQTGRLANGDWIALLTEQGLFAFAVNVALAMLVLRAAWYTRWRALAAATAAGLLVVGALDAVLQLPAAACVCALVFGIAVSDAANSLPRLAQGMRHSKGSGPRSSAFVWGLACVLALSCCASARRMLGFWARTQPPRGFLAAERAVAWNGADLVARFSLAEAYALKGDCKRARPHLEALRQLLPYHDGPSTLGCQREP